MLKIAEMFGIGLDESYEVTLYDRLALDIRPGDVVYVTGPSGGGKSVLLARLRQAFLDSGTARVVDLAAVDLGRDRPVIELMHGPLGLADAFLLLRTPRELSDGQRYRLRLALAIEELTTGEPSAVLVADEFCSTLDRLCAQAVAYRVRRLADAHGITVLAASAHDDLLEDLAPDVLVVKHEAGRVAVLYADPPAPEEAGTPRAWRPVRGEERA
jgi:hypothetical protein